MITGRVKSKEEEYTVLIENGRIYEAEGDMFSGLVKTDRELDRDQVTFLAPVKPGKIMAVGKNYYAHVQEFDAKIPTSPIIFMKPATAVIGPEETIVRPTISERVDYEGELALVVKKMARNVKAADYRDYVLGYTILNDVTARDIQYADGQWTRGKSFDTFAPIGPVVTDEIEPECVNIQTRLNGKTVQNSNTEKFIFPLGEIFEFVTRFTTLEPGDILTTGTPEGVGPIVDGDVVEITIDGIGTLRNTVRDEQ